MKSMEVSVTGNSSKAAFGSVSSWLLPQYLERRRIVEEDIDLSTIDEVEVKVARDEIVSKK